jgi:hypothetical protein
MAIAIVTPCLSYLLVLLSSDADTSDKVLTMKDNDLNKVATGYDKWFSTFYRATGSPESATAEYAVTRSFTVSLLFILSPTIRPLYHRNFFDASRHCATQLLGGSRSTVSSPSSCIIMLKNLRHEMTGHNDLLSISDHICASNVGVASANYVTQCNDPH